ncbi:uncharacterized protein [Nicotiana tomentosiformis]|uniref:uncharacterized protein n=1 Tax=Nicotiana tomentosiformis TaxID=4098 RepID=UPI00388CCC0D
MVITDDSLGQNPGTQFTTEHTTQSTRNQVNQANGIDYNHPLFLSPVDVSGIQIISFQLTRIENYSIWFRSMRVALLGRNKLGMVNGTWKKERFSEIMWNHWKKVNVIVLSWIMNSVAKVGGIMYASSAQVNLWEEFEGLVPARGCDCPKSREFVSYLQKLKLYQFMMGLNDSYSQVRIEILIRGLTLTINQTYALIVSDEGQKPIPAITRILGAYLTGQMGSFEAAMYSNARGNQNQNQRFRRNYNDTYCEFCKMKGHSKENCYKIVGYPVEFKNKKKKEMGVQTQMQLIMSTF